jgi:hypothetical protein
MDRQLKPPRSSSNTNSHLRISKQDNPKYQELDDSRESPQRTQDNQRLLRQEEMKTFITLVVLIIAYFLTLIY